MSIPRAPKLDQAAWDSAVVAAKDELMIPLVRAEAPSSSDEERKTYAGRAADGACGMLAEASGVLAYVEGVPAACLFLEKLIHKLRLFDRRDVSIPSKETP